MEVRILAPVQKNDGCSIFRIETPARLLAVNGFEITLHQFWINKFKSIPISTRVPAIDRIAGSVWDKFKLLERLSFANKQIKFDAVWLSRSLLSFPNHADEQLKNVIFDVDDAIWLAEARHCFESYCKRARVVFAGNKFVADKASGYTSSVEVIPTSVDTDRYRPEERSDARFRVGWIGGGSGFTYLQDIQDDLLSFFRKRKDARLVIIADRYPRELALLKPYIEFVRWSRDHDASLINSLTVGLMPLRQTEWDRGKCSLKMLQYMACGIPSLVSSVGMNQEVMEHARLHGTFGLAVRANWSDALDEYYLMSESDRRIQGMNGRTVVVDHYSTVQIVQKIEAHLRHYL